MRPLRHPLLPDTIDFLKSNGAQDIEPSRGGKHFEIRFKFKNQSLITVTSVSPSDQRAGMKQRTQLKRILREATERAEERDGQTQHRRLQQ
jgi:hypothetical protein